MIHRQGPLERKRRENMSNIHFDGPCPFLLCWELGPHDHPVCPSCGAVRYGNMLCATCQQGRREDPEGIYGKELADALHQY